MRANEYIKRYGIDKARELYNSDDWSTVSDVFLGNLKRLIASHELVAKHGGIDFVKDMVIHGITQEDFRNKLKQAIADVESCL